MDEKSAEIMENALRDIVAAHVPDQPASSQADETTWVMQHVGTIRAIAKNALDRMRATALAPPTRTVCSLCGTWRSVPCGEGCVFGIEGIPGQMGFRSKLEKNNG